MNAVQESQNAEKQEWKRPVLQRLRSNEAEAFEGQPDPDGLLNGGS